MHVLTPHRLLMKPRVKLSVMTGTLSTIVCSIRRLWLVLGCPAVLLVGFSLNLALRIGDCTVCCIQTNVTLVQTNVTNYCD